MKKLWLDVKNVIALVAPGLGSFVIGLIIAVTDVLVNLLQSQTAITYHTLFWAVSGAVLTYVFSKAHIDVKKQQIEVLQTYIDKLITEYLTKEALAKPAPVEQTNTTKN